MIGNRREFCRDGLSMIESQASFSILVREAAMATKSTALRFRPNSSIAVVVFHH